MTVSHMWYDNRIVDADTTEDQSGGNMNYKDDKGKLLRSYATSFWSLQ